MRLGLGHPGARRRRAVFSVAALAAAGCLVLLGLHLRERARLRAVAIERAELRQARVDLAHGALHALLAADGTPFDAAAGRARLAQALATLTTIARRLDPPPVAAEVARDAARLSALLAAPGDRAAEWTAQARVALHRIDRQAARIDAHSQRLRDAQSSRQDARFDQALLFAALALAATSLGLVSASRARDASEQALLSERGRLRTLLDTIPDLVWSKDLAGAYIAANPGVERRMGTAESELLGRTDFDFLDRAQAESCRDRDQAALAAESPLLDEAWVPFADGRQVLLETVRAPVRDGQGRLLGVLGIARDVTERRRTESLVQKQAVLLARTSALAHIGGWEFDVATGIGTWTDEVARIHDLDPVAPASAALGLSFFEGVHREAIDRAIREAIEERRSYDLELELVSARGVRKRVRTVGQPVVEGGRVTRLEGVFQDISRRHQAEESLRRSEELLRQLAENVDEVFWVTDVDKTTVLYVSPAYERIWGRSCESLLAEPASWRTAIHGEDRARVEAALSEQAAGGYDIEYRILDPDGTSRTIHERAFPVRDASGRPIRLVGVAEDVTAARAELDERLRLQERLRQVQKMEAVGRLAGGVAHDFNNMLGVILGHVALAERGLCEGRSVERHVEEIRTAAERSAGLTRQLLQFSRQRPLAAREVNLDEQVAGLTGLLRHLVGEDLDLIHVRAEVPWAVTIDPSQVDQVLTNLAVNARDAMPDGGRLTVEVRNVTLDEQHCRQHPGARPGEYVLLVVSDTGCGMDAETVSRACEPFFTTKPDGRGTGLGLATVYGIAEQNGGFLHVYSELGHGTTVRLYLPRCRAQAGIAAESVPAAPAGMRGEVVLLVEDEDALREITGELLRELGYEVLTASGPEPALALLRDSGRRVDLLLTDVVMPGLDGRQLAELARAMRPGLRVLFASGYTTDVIAHRGLLEPGIDFVEKPYTLTTLAQRVRAALARESAAPPG